MGEKEEILKKVENAALESDIGKLVSAIYRGGKKAYPDDK